MNDTVWTIIFESLTINNVYTTSLVMDSIRASRPPPLLEDDILKD